MFINSKDVKPALRPFTVPHKGIVKDNNDPLKLGRVRCVVSDMFDETDFTLLPWISPWKDSFLGGSLTSEKFDVPEIDSELVIEFPFDDVYFPFYTGYWASKTTHNQIFDVDYPDTYGWADSKGNSLLINKKTGVVKFTHNAGTTIIIDATGKVTIGANTAAEFIVMENKLINKFNLHTHPYTDDGSPMVTGTPTTPLVAGDVASLEHKVGV
jgi:hypothetical protein